MNRASDIKIEDHGTIVMFHPLSEAGVEWMSQNLLVEEWQRWGQAITVDHRMARDIIDGMRADGLVLQ